MKLTNIRYSNHLLYERADRLAQIHTVGIGQPIKESWHYDCYHVLTDTGVVLVIDKDGVYCVTAYFIDHREANKLYRGKTPKAVQRRIDRNIAAGLVNRRR